MDLVRGLIAVDKKMREEHIGYILREVIKVSVGHYDSLINLLANERPTRMPFSAPDSHFSRIDRNSAYTFLLFPIDARPRFSFSKRTREIESRTKLVISRDTGNLPSQTEKRGEQSEEISLRDATGANCKRFPSQPL